MSALKTDYVNDVLDTSENEERVYDIVDSNGNVIEANIRIREKTVLSTEGDEFGAEDINETNGAINQINSDLTELNNNNIGDVVDLYNTSSTNKYTTPVDGYLQLYVDNANSYVSAFIEGANGNTMGAYIGLIPYFNQKIFVKKGMKLYKMQGYGNYAIGFYPLE